MVTLRDKKVSFTINRSHYAKLQELHECAVRRATQATLNNTAKGSRAHARAHPPSYHLTKPALDAAILALALRYDAMSGGTKDGSGGGMQGALNGNLFDVLGERLGARFELFASPFNCRYANFCSAFDLDALFGSHGSFFDLEIKEDLTCAYQPLPCKQHAYAPPAFSLPCWHAVSCKAKTTCEHKVARVYLRIIP